MTSAVIRILGPVLEATRSLLLRTREVESVAFLSARYFEVEKKIVFLADRVVPAGPKDYLKRSDLHLEVSPLYVSRVISVAEDIAGTVIMSHSHPFDNARPRYSISDDYGEARTSETISKCLGSSPPVGSLLFGSRRTSARSWTGKSRRQVQCALAVLSGTAFQHVSGENNRVSTHVDAFSRQVLAVGSDAQDQIHALHIGVVGLGGTGSSIAEQLVRLGVKRLTLVDCDRFEASNWSRLYGSTSKDIGKTRRKTDIVSSHLKRINSKIECRVITDSVLKKSVLSKLAGCDFVFSCVDRHAPRAVLNELAYQCFVPIIDIGVGLDRRSGDALMGTMRSTLIGPGLPCLFCQEIVRPEFIAAEHLRPEDYEARRKQGYVPSIGENAAAVIPYTTCASSIGAMLFLDAIAGLREDAPSNLLLDVGSKKVMRVKGTQKEECVCKSRLGLGFSKPFSVAD